SAKSAAADDSNKRLEVQTANGERCNEKRWGLKPKTAPTTLAMGEVAGHVAGVDGRWLVLGFWAVGTETRCWC
ncbi:hypothetical protein U1Q18_027445, partial [Sarracenia purpurea var. burkii]